ncbi:MAG: class I SAM-dependent methyltransferase [Candidatus Velthaea sp.]
MSTELQRDITYYNEEWSKEERFFANAWQLTRAAAILRAIADARLTRPAICELGSGTGWLTSILGSVGDATGVELSTVAVEKARARYQHVDFVCADALTWDHPRHVFDVVVSHESIEHVDDQQRYVDLCCGLLKPGGLLVLTTPNARTVAAIPAALRSHQPHENIMTAAQLRRLLRTHFPDIRITTSILAGGTSGVYRLVSSVRLRKVVRRLRLESAFDALALRAGFGLHLIAIARKH